MDNLHKKCVFKYEKNRKNNVQKKTQKEKKNCRNILNI